MKSVRTLKRLTFSREPLTFQHLLLQSRAGLGDYEALMALLLDRTELSREELLRLTTEELQVAMLDFVESTSERAQLEMLMERNGVH
jgi:hypothetical protein